MSDPVPPWAYERTEVRRYDPRWPARAEAERARLTEALAPWLVDGVEHVGSTAVPGLAAKPIVDLMASVADLGAVAAGEQAHDLLAADGWCHVPPDLDGRPWRRFFVRPDPSGLRRAAHLHVLTAGHPRWSAQLAFRDALRADTRLAREYEELKRRLADRHGDDREGYTEAKTDFIARVLGPGVDADE